MIDIIIINPQLGEWGKMWINIFPEAICAQVNVKNPAGIETAFQFSSHCPLRHTYIHVYSYQHSQTVTHLGSDRLLNFSVSIGTGISNRRGRKRSLHSWFPKIELMIQFKNEPTIQISRICFKFWFQTTSNIYIQDIIVSWNMINKS